MFCIDNQTIFNVNFESNLTKVYISLKDLKWFWKSIFVLYRFILLITASWLSSLSCSGPEFSTTAARPVDRTSPRDLVGVDVWNSPEAARRTRERVWWCWWWCPIAFLWRLCWSTTTWWWRDGRGSSRRPPPLPVGVVSRLAREEVDEAEGEDCSVVLKSQNNDWNYYFDWNLLNLVQLSLT